MFVGGYISAAGLGLTCPEWPLCPNGIMPDDEYFIPNWIRDRFKKNWIQYGRSK